MVLDPEKAEAQARHEHEHEHEHDIEDQRRPSTTHSYTTSSSNPEHHRRNDSHSSAGKEDPEPHHDALIPTTTLGGRSVADADVETAPCRATRSRAASSTRSRALTIVPRAQRRGLFGRFAIVPEVERPYDYKNSTKWGITVTISAATAAAPLGSAIFYRKFSLYSNKLLYPCPPTYRYGIHPVRLYLYNNLAIPDYHL